jgi:hypothetical protein
MKFGSRVSPAFDTHELVKRLVASGFTSDQAEVVLESMKQAAEQYASTADSMYPTKIEMIEKNLAYKADFAAMKSDLVLMLKQDVALLKSEIHKVFFNLRKSFLCLIPRLSCTMQLETVIGKETTAYQTKLEQLENKSIKYAALLLQSILVACCIIEFEQRFSSVSSASVDIAFTDSGSV